MGRRYDQSDLNTYGAEDDEEMDSILMALDAWERRENGQGAGPNSSRRRTRGVQGRTAL